MPNVAASASTAVGAVDAIVVIPARDEQARIGACLSALAAQTLPGERFATIVVLDGCSDRTEAVVAAAAANLHLQVTTVAGPGAGCGPARRTGMELACAQLLEAGRPHGLIACTDADSRPRPDWLERQLEHVAAGARAIAGLIELDPQEASALPPAVLRRRERDAMRRLRQVRRTDPGAAHHHAGGASLAVTAEAYRAVGGIEPLRALEDANFARQLDRHGIRLLRPADVSVHTSARSTGRAERGLSVDLAVSSWYERRRYRAQDFDAERLRAHKGSTTVTVIIPAKECAETIVGVLERTVAPLARAGLVDETVVVDAGSRDGTAAAAAAAGARVLQQDEVDAELGPALGKGDAMWRALQVTGGDLVCFLDADTADPTVDHLLGLLGPILSDRSLALVKGAFERPLDAGAFRLPHEGGRVTELMARPLLNLHEPLLAAFSQPLAGEFAARRDLLESIPFPVGYGVEIAVLVDALRARGLDALAECHLGSRQNRHQPLRKLGEMSYAVLAAMENRLEARPGPARRPGDASAVAGRYLRPWQDGLVVDVPVGERPPLVDRFAQQREPMSQKVS
jgi:glucosyl-3-phosphoglycerate synthase